MNIYVVTNNNVMLEGLKGMFSDNSLSVNRVLFSRITEIACKRRLSTVWQILKFLRG